MNSLILRAATQILVPLLFLIALWLLFRGHNQPGGGFIGGLVASAGIGLYFIAFSVDEARKLLRIQPQTLIGAGLLTAVFSGLISLLGGKPFLTSHWATWSAQGMGRMKIGTPLLFDIGVFMVVIGVVCMIIFTLAEEQ